MFPASSLKYIAASVMSVMGNTGAIASEIDLQRVAESSVTRLQNNIERVSGWRDQYYTWYSDPRNVPSHLNLLQKEQLLEEYQEALTRVCNSRKEGYSRLACRDRLMMLLAREKELMK